MKQIIFKDGSANLIDVPTPVVLSKSILIKVVNSCISAGTELSSMIGTKDGLIKRALKQPEKIIKASAYLKDEGLIKYSGISAAKGESYDSGEIAFFDNVMDDFNLLYLSNAQRYFDQNQNHLN